MRDAEGSTPHQTDEDVSKTGRRRFLLVGLVLGLVAIAAIFVLFADPIFESAVANDNVGQVKLLGWLDLIDVNEPRDAFAGEMPLLIAAIRGQTEMVKALISSGADVNIIDDSRGFRTLHIAAFGGHTEMAEELISAGAEVGATDSDGFIPLHFATIAGHTETAKVLGCVDNCIKLGACQHLN